MAHAGIRHRAWSSTGSAPLDGRDKLPWAVAAAHPPQELVSPADASIRSSGRPHADKDGQGNGAYAQSSYTVNKTLRWLSQIRPDTTRTNVIQL